MARDSAQTPFRGQGTLGMMNFENDEGKTGKREEGGRRRRRDLGTTVPSLHQI